MNKKLRDKVGRGSALAAAAVVLSGGVAAGLGIGSSAEAATAPARPVITGVTGATNSGFTVSWRALPAGQTAELQVYGASTGRGYVHYAGLTGTSKVVTGLPSGTPVYVRMTADAPGLSSGWTAPLLEFTATSPGQQGLGGLPYRTEVDNGTEFTVSSKGSVSDTSASGATYSDAGIMVDDGPASGLSASDFAFTATGTDASSIGENVWLGTGPQASVDGIYPLTGTDFCYGLGADYVNGVPTQFTMQSQCTDSGQTLTIAQIAAAYPNVEAYTWAGVTANGTATVGPVSITSLAGQDGLTAKVGVSLNSGVMTPSVSS